nr:RNA-directed DNA polymerase, eukaryota [Tanacetum cinerariifolium]
MWVLFEFDSLASKEKFLNHSGIGSWFTELIQATSSFENDERIVWISIEGLPIKAWTPNTFRKISSLWELDAWFPNFQEDDQDDLSSDGESQEGDITNKADNNESDADRVSESSFMHENNIAHKDVNNCKKGEVGSHSEDPFNIYGYAFTWAHKSASKMSKLDRYLISEGVLDFFPHLSALCLDRHLSDHRPILLRETNYDYGPSPFWFFHSWFAMEGFNSFVETTWKSLNIVEPNGLIRLKNKLQALKIAVNAWSKDDNKRITLLNDLQELNNRNAMEISQKAKIRWSIEGDENYKYFNGIMNKKRYQLAIRGTLANEEWISEPHRVKNEFFTQFKKQFSPIQAPSICFDFTFLTRLSSDKVQDLERIVI